MDSKFNLKNNQNLKGSECHVTINPQCHEVQVSEACPTANIYYNCLNCDYKTPFKRVLSKHCKTHTTSPFVFKCKDCLYICNSNEELTRHITKMHNTSFSCTNCLYITKDKCDLEQHLRSHSVEEPFQCNICAFKTPWKRDYELHMSQHEQSTAKPLQHECNRCDFKTYRWHLFESHLAEHTKLVKSIKCDFCAYETSREILFVAHMRRHTCQKQIACNNCGLQFAWEGSLNQHLKLHLPTNRCGSSQEVIVV